MCPVTRRTVRREEKPNVADFLALEPTSLYEEEDETWERGRGMGEARGRNRNERWGQLSRFASTVGKPVRSWGQLVRDKE
jgi:hypothetical protein